MHHELNGAPLAPGEFARPCPKWFADAKLGIFIHWGLYSVPAWAPVTSSMWNIIEQEGWPSWFRNNPYAEWYDNTLRIPDSPTAKFHAQHYGTDRGYRAFAGEFNAGLHGWDPQEWVALFAAAGARYAVLTTKHHDGFLLWPSRHLNPHNPGYHCQRDLVGDLTTAVRASGLRMGLYYSGGLDWTFDATVIDDGDKCPAAVPQTAEYAGYADAHWRELIECYQPDVLWNDIAYPDRGDLRALFTEYYQKVPEGVVNDRFYRFAYAGQAAAMDQMVEDKVVPRPEHYDYRTPEYSSYPDIRSEKWESCRGLGFSFGYNRNEDQSSVLSARELIQSFVDIVSKNGNLLLNVGPMADGTIPPVQRQRLLELGGWLTANGEGIFGSRPWTQAAACSCEGIEVRFTCRDHGLYLYLFDPNGIDTLTLAGVSIPRAMNARLLGDGRDVGCTQCERSLTLHLPPLAADLPVVGVRIEIAV